MAGSSEGFFKSGPGKVVAVVSTLICLALAGYVVYGALRGSAAVTEANTRVFLDVSNNQAFRVKLDDLVGQAIPIKSPYSGTNTGYPAELCYWKADGSVKDDPTPVVLKNLLGQSGPTFCPDCGRLVVGNNPHPVPGMKPPLTQAEWRQRHQQ